MMKTHTNSQDTIVNKILRFIVSINKVICLRALGIQNQYKNIKL